MNEKWRATVYLLPGHGEGDRSKIAHEFATAEEAMRWASDAVLHAHAESDPETGAVLYLPAHRMSHAVVERAKPPHGPA